MFAIIETGGKQYRVAPNEKIIVEKIDQEAGKKITLDKVLLLKDDKGEVSCGAEIKGVKVEAEVVKTFKDKKVIIFKKRRRQNSRRKQGHRQQQTLLKILSIKA